jgi:hypothetical protein
VGFPLPNLFQSLKRVVVGLSPKNHSYPFWKWELMFLVDRSLVLGEREGKENHFTGNGIPRYNPERRRS